MPAGVGMAGSLMTDQPALLVDGATMETILSC